MSGDDGGGFSRRHFIAGLAASTALAGCSESVVNNSTNGTDGGTSGSNATATPGDTTGTATSDGTVTNRLSVVSAVGTEIEDGNVGRVELVVKLAPGSEEVDLRNVTAQYISATSVVELVHAESSAAGGGNTFGVEPVKDDNRSLDEGTLDSPDDRAKLVLDIGWSASGPGDATDIDALAQSATAYVTLMTPTGGETEVMLTVPDTLAGREAVSLGGSSTGGGDPTPTDGGDGGASAVSNRVEVVNVVGDQIESLTVGRVLMTVKKAAGADDIDLTDITIQWVGPDGTATLVHADTAGDGSNTAFTTKAIKDDDDSIANDTVLNDEADRAQIILDIGGSSSGPSAAAIERIGEGESAVLALTTGSGGETRVNITVPETLSGDDAVTLSP